MFWRKPVTHATVLWVLVGVAAGAFVAVMAYASALAHVRQGIVEARPAKSGEKLPQPPTLFGTVVSFDGTVVKVDSKQPFDEIVLESDTTITTVGGSAVDSSALKAGAVVTATGLDIGGGRLSAIAIVILENR